MNNKRILVFQHLAIEHPGIFREFFREDGYTCHTVELDEGDDIPDLQDFDALWVMGGPMDVWQEDHYPWLVDEKQAIKHAVDELQMPFVGICLGHQLLASAMGAEVGLSNQAEVGVMSIEQTETGKQNPFLKNIPAEVACLQWHSAEVKTVPPGFDVLAESENCAVQSLGRGKQVFTMQYHQEILPTTVPEWNEIPEYKLALEKALGENAGEKLQETAQSYMQLFNKTARTFYDNWKLISFPE